MSTTDTRAAFKAWAEREGYDTAHTHDGIKWLWLNPMTADLSKAYQAATEAAKATGTAGEQWKPKALQGPRKSIFYGGNTNEHLNPLVVLISAEDYEKCCSLCEAPRVPHEMAYTVGGVADVSYVNGWNDCRDTVLGKIDDDPTNAPAEAARQPAPVLGLKMICDPNMPSDQVEFRMNGETVGRIVNIAATKIQPEPVSLSDQQIWDLLVDEVGVEHISGTGEHAQYGAVLWTPAQAAEVFRAILAATTTYRR